MANADNIYDFSGKSVGLYGAKSALDEPKVSIELAINILKPYHNHMFGLYQGSRLDDMVASVRDNGVLVPILVREYEGSYEILAGHNRVNAAKLVGLTTVPARVLENITDEQAELITIESNLCQRSFGDLPHSEKAKTLKKRYELLKHQGKRNDLTNEIDALLIDDSEAALADTKDTVAQEYYMSPSTVQRYVKLADLHRALLALVDNGSMPFMAGVHLAYLDVWDQDTVADLVLDEGIKVTVKNAETLRSAKKLDEDRIREILTGVLQVKPKAAPTAKIRPKVYRAFLPEHLPVKSVEQAIVRALELCQENGLMDDVLEGLAEDA